MSRLLEGESMARADDGVATWSSSAIGTPKATRGNSSVGLPVLGRDKPARNHCPNVLHAASLSGCLYSAGQIHIRITTSDVSSSGKSGVMADLMYTSNLSNNLNSTPLTLMWSYHASSTYVGSLPSAMKVAYSQGNSAPRLQSGCPTRNSPQFDVWRIVLAYINSACTYIMNCVYTYVYTVCMYVYIYIYIYVYTYYVYIYIYI